MFERVADPHGDHRVDDHVTGGGEAGGARDLGKLRLEGKEYEVADGGVMHFRFAT